MSQLEYGFTNSAEDQQLRIGWTPEHSEHHQNSTMLLSSSTHSISQDTEEPEPKLEPSEYAASEASFTTSLQLNLAYSFLLFLKPSSYLLFRQTQLAIH